MHPWTKEQALLEWAWMIQVEAYSVVDVSPFGDLVLRDALGHVRLLDVNFGRIVEPVAGSTGLVEAFPENYDQGLIASYEAAGLVVGAGQCYGFTTPTICGGAYDPSNVWLATAAEYAAWMGDFHAQVRDIPDGSQIEIVVKSLPDPTMR